MRSLGHIGCAVVALLAWPLPSRAQEVTGEPEAEAEVEAGTALKGLTAEAFLQEVRRPFQQEAWGEATGTIQLASDKQGERRGTVRLRMTFAPDSLHAQLVLNDTNVYGFEQKHGGQTPATTRVDLPDQETPPGLFEFGIEPEDLTFAFIYWDFRRELPAEDFLRRSCRVLELAHPQGKGCVRVWFSASHGYPLKAEWYRPDSQTPWRKLELKGAKKHGKDLWFVKELRLDGDGWKTRVRFDHAEINPVEERAAPADPK
jgi:hypothetical protein